MILPSVLVFLAFVYVGIMFAYIHGWQAMPEWALPTGYEPENRVTVVIAARNEAGNILDCLNSILNGAYPAKLLQIIVVDDFSDDETAGLVAGYISKKAHHSPDIQLLQLEKSLPPERRFRANKKKAIELAVAQASGSIIVSTDADCWVPTDWLMLLVSRFEAQPKLAILAAPVVIHRERNVLQRFQSLDFLGMMGITAAGIQLGWHRMGNGANLSYRKDAFLAVDGYAGNEQIASGDDMFLMQKMAERWPGCVGFLKNSQAAVRTEAMPNWSGFWQQRLRWGSKNAGMREWPIRLILLAVWMFCMGIWVSGLLCLLGYFSWQVLVFQVFAKMFGDWLLLKEMCGYFGRRDLMRWFLPSFLIHTGYIAFAGLGSLMFEKYRWKGREVASS